MPPHLLSLFYKVPTQPARSFMTPHFFGPLEQQLFGALHHGRGSQEQPCETVVICPPIGQEYIRTHWCLRLLARQLSRKGINVLRFDYRGIGDSAGTNLQTTSPKQWHADVHAAIEFACEQTNCRNVMLLGLRYGGTIASAVAAESDKVNSLVLWEPVIDTSKYLESLQAMHQAMIDLWVCKIENVVDADSEEILGSLYNCQLLAEMKKERLDLAGIDQPQFILDLYDRRGEFEANEMQRFMPTDDEDSWSNLALLETSWLRAKTSRQVTLMADEMFCRLKKFDQLGTLTATSQSKNVPLPTTHEVSTSTGTPSNAN